MGAQGEGDVDALAAGLAPAPGAAHDLAEVQGVDEDGAVDAGVGGDGDDHVFSRVSPAACRAFSSVPVMPVSVMSRSRSVSSPYLWVETWPILLWSAQQDASACAAEHEALDGGFGGVRGGEAAVEGDAVGAEEGDVDVDLAEGAGGPAVHLGEREVPDAAAERVDGEVRLAGQGERGRQGVGERGELAVGRDELGEPGRGGAGVDQDGAGPGEMGQRGLGDAPLLLGVLDAGGDLGFEGEVLQRGIAPPWTRRSWPWRSSAMRSLRTVSPVTDSSSAMAATSTRPVVGQRAEDGLLALRGVERLVGAGVRGGHRAATGDSSAAGRG